MARNLDGDQFALTVSSGISIVNAMFNLAIPVCEHQRLAEFSQGMEHFRSADVFYQQLTDALCGTSEQQSETYPYARLNALFVKDRADIAAMSGEIAYLATLSDKALIDAANDVFCFDKPDLLRSFDSEFYAWFKINHGWWERLVLHASGQSGGVEFESLSQDIIMMALRKTAKKDEKSGIVDCTSDGIAFAISFNAGRLWHSEITAPLEPYIRRAMLAAGPYFKTVMGGERFVVSDGVAAKKLAYDDRLRDFCDLVRSWSDVVVFIVPDHLKKIALADFSGTTIHITVPQTKIYEFWPSTLCYVAGTIAEIVETGLRITVLVQAAAISAPIATLVALLGRDAGAKLRVYDFGQVLDLAEPTGRRTYKWAKDLEAFLEFANIHSGSFLLS